MNLARFKLFISAAILLLSSCTSQENTFISGIGWIAFDLSVDETPGAEATQPFALTLAMEDGPYSHTWSNIKDVLTYESYYTGTYTAVATSGTDGAEGYGCPCYTAYSTFLVNENQRNVISLRATLTQAIANVAIDPALQEKYPGIDVSLHSQKHGYVHVDTHSDSPLLISPGTIAAFVSLPRDGAEPIIIAPDFYVDADAASTVEISVSLSDSGDAMVLSGRGKETVVPLTEEVLNSPLPSIQAEGFVPDTPVVLTEGYPSDKPLIADISAPAGLRSVIITSQLPNHASGSLSHESDLITNSTELVANGLVITSDDEGKHMSLNFTKLIENLSVTAKESASFTIVAYDNLGRATAPMSLILSIASVDILESWCTPAIIGEDIAAIDLRLTTGSVEASDFSIYLLDEKGNEESQAQITDATISADEKLAKLKFKIPAGTQDVSVRIYYMDLPKAYATVTRRVPEYQMSVDAFATHAVLMLKADDQAKTSALIKYASVLANGSQTVIYSRNADTGTLVIAGLKPSSSYTIEPVILPGGFSVKANITTESNSSVPEGDFEDFTDLFKYSRMPMGGPYSSTAFPIFTQQNFADFNVKWVKKHWTSVNDKTFCRSASNHNTWYMQPSAMLDFDNHASGGKSMKICSVGWSIDGEDIAPYAQQPDEYLPYNNNVPEVAHTSAGKLFIGSYKFDPASLQETYTEGTSFTSRPSALNGFYRYMPASNALDDSGTATIEIMGVDNGQEIVIASATIDLPPAPDFLSFNIPLTYEKPGIKASKLKIMFASSRFAGSIEEEDANVPVSADVANARFIGGMLWIDNLTFSY